MFGEECAFDVLKIEIEVGTNFSLVRSAINKGIDDEFVLLRLIKGKGHVEFLVFGVRNDTGCHGLIFIKILKL